MNTDLERQFRSSDERAQTRLALKDSTRKPSHPVRASEICMRASSTTDQNSSDHLIAGQPSSHSPPTAAPGWHQTHRSDPQAHRQHRLAALAGSFEETIHSTPFGD